MTRYKTNVMTTRDGVVYVRPSVDGKNVLLMLKNGNGEVPSHLYITPDQAREVAAALLAAAEAQTNG